MDMKGYIAGKALTAAHLGHGGAALGSKPHPG